MTKVGRKSKILNSGKNIEATGSGSDEFSSELSEEFVNQLIFNNFKEQIQEE